MAALTIRPAAPTEFAQVRAFYHSLIDAMQSASYQPGWKKDIYPDNDDLQNAIARQELYVGTVEDEIACAMIVNHVCNESYENVIWLTSAKPEEVTVIHTLGVHPRFGGRGYAKQLVAKVIEIARCNRQKVIRLDVLAGNLPAERLYVGLGFRYVDTVNMFYEDTGWTDFLLYEYPL